MSDFVRWLKTGERGARAEFTDSDLLTTLILLQNEPIGRYKLQTMLNLSDSSTKSLLNYCKKKELLSITSNRLGHELTSKGKEIINRISEVITYHEPLDLYLFENVANYFVLLEKTSDSIATKPSWKFRDIAIAYGASAILFISISSEGTLDFPEGELKLEEYYPNLEDFFQQKFADKLCNYENLLIVSAPSLEVARKSAIITSLHSNTRILTEIQTFLK